MTWLTHALIAAAISAPIVYSSSRRVDWHPVYLLVLVVPVALWMLVALLFPLHGKSMSNFVIEVGAITLGVPIALLIRVLMGRLISTGWGAIVVVTTVSAVALVLYFALPPLPE